MKIVVTAKNIHDGYRYNADWCPIAWACKDAGLKHPEVACGQVAEYEDWESQDADEPSRTWTLPAVANLFIIKFDRQEPVFPFEFEMEEKQ